MFKTNKNVDFILLDELIDQYLKKKKSKNFRWNRIVLSEIVLMDFQLIFIFLSTFQQRRT